MKLLLYCTKNKWRLFFDKVKQIFTLGKVKSNNDLNGKIVAECDYEVEEIGLHKIDVGVGHYCLYETNLLDDKELINQSCLDCQQLVNYLGTKKDYGEVVGYAIHIKNLNIFDKPRDLRDYYTENPYKDINNIFTDELMIDGKWHRPVNHAPQNMMYAFDNEGNKYIVISIQSQWMCKILNGEKTIECRKRILKEMMPK